MKTIRIGLITTINTNIGDDFIRDGIVQILRHVYGHADVRFFAINKHKPFSVYPMWHPLRWLELLDHVPRGQATTTLVKTRASLLLHGFGGSHFDKMDAIVHCGAPMMWPGCHRSVWATTLWEHVVARISPRIPVLTLAAGSAYPWENQPDAIMDPSDAAFIRNVLSSSRVVTARDELYAGLAKPLGYTIPTIPCSAFLVGRRFTAPPADEQDVVLFNYMPGAGHWSWGQRIDSDRWMATAKALIESLSRRHQVVFLCHDQNEYEAAGYLNAALPRFLPTSIESYVALIRRSKAAVTNRIHAAVALASLGIPAISVGTDTRMLMLQPIGVPFRYVKDPQLGNLVEELEILMIRRGDERERLIALRDATWSQYVETVAGATSS